jgi:hypothetical protein
MFGTQTKLEEALMRSWSTKDDIDVLYNYFGEHTLTQDEIMNALLGMSQLHQMRSEQAFDLFEKYIKERYAEHAERNE